MPLGIGAAGVITSLVGKHGWSIPAVPERDGAHAGGFGFVALIGFVSPLRCASGSGSSWPLGSPGEVGCLNANVAGRPLTVIEEIVMSVPGAPPIVSPFLASKSRLKS